MAIFNRPLSVHLYLSTNPILTCYQINYQQILQSCYFFVFQESVKCKICISTEMVFLKNVNLTLETVYLF